MSAPTVSLETVVQVLTEELQEVRGQSTLQKARIRELESEVRQLQTDAAEMQANPS